MTVRIATRADENRTEIDLLVSKIREDYPGRIEIADRYMPSHDAVWRAAIAVACASIMDGLPYGVWREKALTKVEDLLNRQHDYVAYRSEP